ncbi:MAG: hypothetical protein ACH255_07100 [Candidatus Thiodiazotropha sp.]
MRNKTYALLITGIFSVMLMPSTSAVEGASYPGAGKWRPIQGQNRLNVNWNDLSPQPGQNVWPAAWARGNDFSLHRPQPYSVRSWKGHAGHHKNLASSVPNTSAAPYDRPDNGAYVIPAKLHNPGYQGAQEAVVPRQFNWRPAAQSARAGQLKYGPNSQYRFRPMEQERQREAPPRWTYRPAQLEIPNHYVYRPLKVQQRRNHTDQQRQRRSAVPGMQDYGPNPWDPVRYGYDRSWMPMPGSASSPYDPYRYLDSYNQYSAAQSNGRYLWRGDRVGYPVPRGYTAPRYSGHGPFTGHRFRPLKRSGWDRYRYRGMPDRYAVGSYPVANYQWRRPDWANYDTMRREWQPQMAMSYPGPHPMRRPDAPNRYGVNWYDGRGDGEGAWYKLAGQREWPRVSQYLPVD